ncbi:hypothetical protein WG68_07995 [Arsukibacterium ikkense]|uniref:YknX-like C-terminal permuted SH3-like domain-containing protein n=1 Tax=Arsukibacterium ikkense TaxID=336831 RepID=A0A0M2V6G8_9GAMM|nr:hypothetical protein WG68_07995 [Arsukibacterium ikkense]
MDRKITKRPPYRKIAMLVFSLLLSCSVLAAIYSNNEKQFSVALNSVEIGTVQLGSFTESLGLRGVIQPSKTVYLDAIEGGRVESLFAEPGQLVSKGQPLLQLSNTMLQLDLISREAQVSEQINFLRNTQISSENNRLNLQRDVLDTKHTITTLERQLTQAHLLKTRNLIPEEQITTLEQELSYQRGKLSLTERQLQQEEDIREQQLLQLTDSVNLLQHNLELARSHARDLKIIAPVSGYLSEFSAEQGEFKTAGARLGQIDLLDSFRLDVQIDEYHLNRVYPGMAGRLQLGQESVEVILSRVDSRVTGNMFKAEFELPADLKQLRRGQTLHLTLQLSDPQQTTVMLPKGAFLTDSGGHYIFVVEQENKAKRRDIKLGKQNNKFIEVLAGLSPGEKVLISSYRHFNNANSITLKD